MTTRLNGFDNIAWLYDHLAKLVFGDRLKNAQATYLHLIKPGEKVLILGGGTGAILEMLFRQQPTCQVTYIDASRAMLERAQHRDVQGSTIQYIHGDEDCIPKLNFDAVIAPFYLDMFTEPDLAATIRKVSSHLRPDALWIVVDFFPSKHLWHQTLLYVMYAFFRVTTGIKAKTLPDWKRALALNGWAESESQSDGFIVSAVFRHG